MSAIFFDAYIDPSSLLGKAHTDRYRCMLEVIGAAISGKKVTNRAAIVPPIAVRVASFADLYYTKILGLPHSTDSGERIRLRIDAEALVDMFITYLEDRL